MNSQFCLLTRSSYCYRLIINMSTVVTITPQWQVYIPIWIRQLISLSKPGRATVAVENDSIVITPKQSSLLRLGAKYKSIAQKKRVNLERIRDRIDYGNL